VTPLTTDTFFDGRITVKQNKRGYRFSLDAVILAAQACPRPGDTIVDLGTGCGIIPLILAYRNPEAKIYGVEVQSELAKIARQNVKDNDMETRINVIQRDMKTLAAGMVSGPVNLVVSNPPYRKPNSGRLNPNHQRAVARHEIEVTLADVVECACRILDTSGKFITIYPAERLPDLLSQMRAFRIEPKLLRAIHSRRHTNAKLVLVEGIKAARPGIKISPPLLVYAKTKVYSKEVQRMFGP
jgi:tRNA1Val (adenine37-N6)-methyltransferase